MRLRNRAQAWRAEDPDPATRALADEAIDRGDVDELAELFEGRLDFGTAGLRAALGPGPNRINRLVARQTAAGIARVLLDSEPSARRRGLVLGHDARSGSEVFALDVAAVVAAHGIPVYAFDGPAPTPLVAFALRHIGAAAAVVVTASHNPATDNGIKVLWSDGAQISDPTDRIIASAIEAAARDGDLMSEGSEVSDVLSLGVVGGNTPLVQAYLEEAARLIPGPPERPLPLAATSLHGVGADLLELTLKHFGHGPLHHVASQRRPDPAFPTVASPNPEEPGTLDRLLELARAAGCSLALANDPDADRLALAVPDRSGSWTVLTGDQTGALLAHRMLELTAGQPDRILVTTVVSSRLLEAMAAAAGVRFAETLTGFKWLCRPTIENPGWNQILAYEESLGYAIGPYAHDKDGITAALVAADTVCALAELGRSPWDVLDDLARDHGAHVTLNGSVHVAGPHAGERLDHIAADLSSGTPDSLGGAAITRQDRPHRDVHRIWLEDDTRVALRPSGTESMFKYYCEAIEPVRRAEDPETASRRARSRLDGVAADLVARLR